MAACSAGHDVCAFIGRGAQMLDVGAIPKSNFVSPQTPRPPAASLRGENPRLFIVMTLLNILINISIIFQNLQLKRRRISRYSFVVHRSFNRCLESE